MRMMVHIYCVFITDIELPYKLLTDLSIRELLTSAPPLDESAKKEIK